MAATKTIESVSVTTTATELAAANADRQLFMLWLQPGAEIWLGVDNTVTPATGFPLTSAQNPFTDAIATTDAWYAVAKAGAVEVRVLEISGT